MSSEELEEPISVIVPAGTTQTISFPQNFFRKITSVVLSNLDGTNVAQYRINGLTQPLLTLDAGAFRVLNGIKINLLIITAGAAGDFQVQAVGPPFVQ